MRLPTDPIRSRGKLKPLGMMPTTVNGLPSSAIVLPMTVLSAPNRRFHRFAPTTTTSAAAAVPKDQAVDGDASSSAGTNAVPVSGFTPSVSNKRLLTAAPTTRSGSPPVVKL